MKRFWDFLCAHATGMRYLAFEYVNASTFKGKDQVDQHISYRAAAILFAALHDMIVIPIHVGTAKKTFTGHGHASKQQMITAAQRLGASPDSDNAADALGVLMTSRSAPSNMEEIVYATSKPRNKRSKAKVSRNRKAAASQGNKA
jgi:hypothetical protein